MCKTNMVHFLGRLVCTHIHISIATSETMHRNTPCEAYVENGAQLLPLSIIVAWFLCERRTAVLELTFSETSTVLG